MTLGSPQASPDLQAVDGQRWPAIELASLNIILGQAPATSARVRNYSFALPDQKEGRMTKFRLIGAAAALSCLLAGPAMARPVIAHPDHYARSI
jgi:hypothetical protein